VDKMRGVISALRNCRQ